MKYFTKDWYRESQVYGFLTLPETKDDWENNLQWYVSEGRDFKKEMAVELEWRRNELLEFLPESFHPHILDGTLKTEYPSDEIRKMVEQWTDEFQQRLRDTRKQYLLELEKGKNDLPKSVLQLHEKSLHDGMVLKCDSISDNEFVMIVEGTGVRSYSSNVKLTFTNVEELSMSGEIVGEDWLYTEIYPTKTGFELHVIFEGTLSELIIKAKDLLIEQLK
nr:DUF4085 family protein [Lysinibacillus timonensis]